ncbi:uroporphyrinogen-III synthase-like isoform X2 [Bacillus rossius redtenbacheri]
MEAAERHVMILKAPAEDPEDDGRDPYSHLLRENGFAVTSVPVIDFEFCNLEELRDCLQAPHKFSGIIFTSPRAVRATALGLGTDQRLPARWSQHAFFVVGRSTAAALRSSLGAEGEGAESGSAVALADYITQRSYAGPLLYPCSSLQRGTLPARLQERGVRAHCVTAYATVPHPGLERSLALALASSRPPGFLVYFSPSGVAASLPVLRGLQLPFHRLKVIAIGAATQAALERSDVPVWAVCKEPTPEQLLSRLSSPGPS